MIDLEQYKSLHGSEKMQKTTVPDCERACKRWVETSEDLKIHERKNNLTHEDIVWSKFMPNYVCNMTTSINNNDEAASYGSTDATASSSSPETTATATTTTTGV